MKFEFGFKVEPHHPCLPGHFPGRPIVPGVVVMDEICSKAVELYPGYRLASVPSVKFTGQLCPGEVADVVLEGGPEELRFHCWVDGNAIASGRLRLTTEEQAS